MEGELEVPSTPASGTPPGAQLSPTRAMLRAGVILCVLVLLTRLPAVLLPRPFDDEQIYSVVADEMLHGGRLYLAAVERKPPLLFVVYAGVLRAAGSHAWPALHLAAVGWTLATMLGLFLTLRLLFDWQSGIIAAALYALFQMWGDDRMLAFNGELLMNLPIVVAILIVFAGRRRPWRPELVLAGALIVIATLLKQPAGIAGVALAWYVLSPGYGRARGLTVRHRAWHAIELAAGFALVLGLAALILAHFGILHEAIYWSILSHEGSVGPNTWHYWDKALSHTLFFLVEALPLCLAAAGSLQPAIFRRTWSRYAPEHRALVVLLGVSLLAVSVNGQFLDHYYLQLLPPLCLLAAPVVRDVLLDTAVPVRWLPGRVGFLGWIGLTLLLFTTVDTIGLSQERRSSAAGAWVKEHSLPTDRLFVWGQSDRKTGMYLDADRRPATRFIASYPLTGHVFGSYPEKWGLAYEDSRVMPGAWDTLRLDFARHPARFIIDAEDQRSDTRYPASRYPVLSELLRTGYRPVDTTDDGIIYQRTSP
jgi:dolichyl-phosphate-mannose-protein mannosyltransferase